MLTTATGVLQGALLQQIERLDPILDRIDEAIDIPVSEISSRERYCCYMGVCSRADRDLVLKTGVLRT